MSGEYQSEAPTEEESEKSSEVNNEDEDDDEAAGSEEVCIASFGQNIPVVSLVITSLLILQDDSDE